MTIGSNMGPSYVCLYVGFEEQILHYSSLHPDHCKRAISYSQFLRLRRIYRADDADFMNRAIEEYFGTRLLHW